MVPALVRLPHHRPAADPEAARRRASQAASQALAGRPAATAPATSAITPMATPPQPGTAVKAVARSIVCRMNERLSIARAWSAGGSGGGARTRWGKAMAQHYNGRLYSFSKYFVT